MILNEKNIRKMIRDTLVELAIKSRDVLRRSKKKGSGDSKVARKLKAGSVKSGGEGLS